MKIPKKLRSKEFKDSDALLIVSGTQGAIIYHLHGKNIETVDSFKVSKPEYSDFEGEFKIRGRGITISSGSVKEIHDENMIKHFLRELKKRVSSLKLNVSSIYLLAPAQTKNKIRQAMPPESRDKVKSIVSGNFSRFHPIELLEKLYAEASPPYLQPV